MDSGSIKTIRLRVDGTNYTGAAGTTTLTSEAVDTQGYERVRFICGFGPVLSGAVTSTKAQQSDASGGTYADLAGTGVSVSDLDDNKIVVTEVIRPAKRFLKHVVVRGTQNATVDFLIVELFEPRKAPVTQDSIVLAQKILASPAEGTA